MSMSTENKTLRTVKLGDFLSQRDLDKAKRLYPDAKAICREVIEPQISAINMKLGQENDPMYLAYAVVFALEAMAKS